jgi:hypothetical protein
MRVLLLLLLYLSLKQLSQGLCVESCGSAAPSCPTQQHLCTSSCQL